jgi:integrase
MAWLELEPSGQFHIRFRIGSRKFKRSLKTKNESEAETRRIRLEETLRLVESGRLTVPAKVDVATYLLSDGQLEQPLAVPDTVGLEELFGEYTGSLPEASMEANSLYTAKIHMKHLRRILRAGFVATDLSLSDLQEYIRKRSTEKGIRGRRVSPTTIKKELTTFSSVWSWARLHGYVDGPFPNTGLRYPKTEEKPPFQTWKTIENQIARGGLSDEEQKDLWDCLFLSAKEITDLLAHVAASNQMPSLHPMCCMAAFTGARRSEILRSQISDFDFTSGTVVIREKKRSRSKRTTRVLPLAPNLREVMTRWLDTQSTTKFTFSDKSDPVTVSESDHHLRQSLSGSRWEKIHGWHLFRHSFISNCAARGIDQRIIDAWSGHQTDEMRKRYTHLFPDTQQDAICLVFSQTTKAIPSAKPRSA